MDGLEVQNITKVYGNTTVVNDVSFQAARGQILGVLGPNGAGKTTIIRMIMGITAPDQGNIFFTHDDLKRQVLPLDLVGYLPEERGLYKEAKVLNILLFLAGLKNVPKDVAKERALRWLERFESETYAMKKIEHLSKGMAQKVQFIASILHEPKLVVLDEPFSGLDPVSQNIFKEEIRNLAKAGTTVLLSSHQMNIVEELCDQIFLINKGNEVVQGDLQQIKERYGNFRVNVLTPDGLTEEFASELVESYLHTGPNRHSYTLKNGVLPQEFLSVLPSNLEIQELAVSRPSLHEIFVRIAQGGEDVA